MLPKLKFVIKFKEPLYTANCEGKCLNVIRSYGKQGITKEKLYDKTRMLTNIQRDDEISSLLNDGFIFIEKIRFKQSQKVLSTVYFVSQ